MNPIHEAGQAAIGWLDIIGNRAGGADRFNTTQRGLVNALGVYLVLVLFSIAVQAVSFGSPGIGQVLLGVFVNALPVLGVALVVWATVSLLAPAVSVYGLLVPAIYALAFILAIGLPLSLFGGNLFSNAMLGALGYMFYRLARYMARLSIGISIAFAVLSIVVLVALPIGLYMVTMPANPAS
jgi:hypothetical protein